jgi:hypothetical protein
VSTLGDPPTPAGAKRFGVYSWVWAAWALIFAVTEGLAIRKNKHGGYADFQHRTLSENARFVFATDRDGRRARLKRLRRFSLVAAVSWLTAHLLTNGGWI